MENVEEKDISVGEINPDALEAALGDDFIMDDEDPISSENYDQEDDVDVAFSQDDPRDWY